MARRISKARHAIGLNQQGLAERLGISQSTVARWESGSRQPSRAQAERLAAALGVSAFWLEFGDRQTADRQSGDRPGPAPTLAPPSAGPHDWVSHDWVSHDWVSHDAERNSISRRGQVIVNPMTENPVIAFQGVAGAFSHLACREVFPDMEPLPCPTFEDAFEAVESGRAGLGMIPIENSLGGRVADIHHLLPDSNLYIVGEHFQPVHHNILAPKGATLEGLKEVRSHEQALAQVRETLRELKIKAVRRADTAGAAQEVAELGDPTVGSISSSLAAEVYGLDVLRGRVEDRIGNTTRFVIMSRTRIEPDPRSGPCLTSFIFSVRSVPAALYKALGGFATSGINMIRLESYISLNDYAKARFYAEIEGHPADKNVDLAFEELGFYTNRVKVIGTYPMNPHRFEE